MSKSHATEAERITEADIEELGAALQPFKNAAFRAANGQNMTRPECEAYDALMAFAREIESRAWQAARAIPQAAAEPVWQKLTDETAINFGKLVDVILTNGVTEYCRRCNQVDWTQVQDWRYAAPDRAPSTEAPNFCDRCGKRLHAGSIHTCTPPGAPSTDSATGPGEQATRAAPESKQDQALSRAKGPFGQRQVAAFGPALCDGYLSGSCISKPTGGATITLHYLSNDKAEAAFNGISDAIDGHIRAIAAMKGEA